MPQEPPQKILIVGGGFGGVRCALDLAKKSLPNTKITLISDKPHFEYHAGLYRVVTGRSPLEVCIPLAEIFRGQYSNVILNEVKDLLRMQVFLRLAERFFGLRPQNDNMNGDVEVVEDTITDVNLKEKLLTGSSGSHYTYDYLVSALGSETSYFDLPGLKEYAFGFKSITDALKLKKHLHTMFSSCVVASDREKECALHFVIVGGGATGIELAGELSVYTKTLAKKHMLDKSLISIDLIQGGQRLLPGLPEDIAKTIHKRLESLGVTIDLNQRVLKKDIETVYLKDMQMRTKTVIWTAGTVPNHLYSEIKGLLFDEKGRVVVDEYLLARGVEDVFVIGDAAATKFAGMAQTAVSQGAFVANFIEKKLTGGVPAPYMAKAPFYAIPVGDNWAAYKSNSVQILGAIGWLIRRLADLRFFLSILPFSKALAAFDSDTIMWESCPICSESS